MASPKNLYEASNQWRNRPPDERFPSLDAMFERTQAYAANAQEFAKYFSDLKVLATSGDLVLSAGQAPAKLTHHAFGQMARLAHAPANYMRELPAHLAAQCLNSGIERYSKTENKPLNIFAHKNSGFVVRALTTEKYDRVYNWQVVQAAQRFLTPRNWHTVPAMPSPHGGPNTRIATEADLSPSSRIRVGQLITDAGLYASDHDMFAFLVKDDETVEFNGHQLYRFALLRNSEVGAGSLAFTIGLFFDVCQNHIIWNAQGIQNIRVRHIKSTQAYDGGNTLVNAVTGWRTSLKELPPMTTLNTQIKAARTKVVGQNGEEVVEETYRFAKGRNLSLLTQTRLEEAFAAAEEHEDWYGNPNTVWGMVNGLTEVSQKTSYADDRAELDRQAGRLMEMAF